MRLINTRTLALEEFTHDAERPVYAILSHRWQAREVNLQQFMDGRHTDWPGYLKVRDFCSQARDDGFEWAWSDTCCINKSGDSGELSEAINSMFAWYRDAGRCYVYLCDVEDNAGEEVRVSELEAILRPSSWFSRGWTLQELIAPKRCSFFDSNWKYIGSKSELAPVISKITRIDARLLKRKRDLDSFSVAQKMSWAAFRKTSRPEDRAYSLFGLFDVTLPTIYGEGHAAFRRLQEKLMALSADQSLFAWTATESTHKSSDALGAPCSVLAPSPDCFHASSSIVPYEIATWRRFWRLQAKYMCEDNVCAGSSELITNVDDGLPGMGPYSMTNMGLQITLMTIDLMEFDRDHVLREAALFCYDESMEDWRPSTIIIASGTKGPRRAMQCYLGRVAKREHKAEHNHWLRRELVIDNSSIWAPPYLTRSFASYDDGVIMQQQRKNARDKIRQVRAEGKKQGDELIAEKAWQKKNEEDAEQRELENKQTKFEKKKVFASKLILGSLAAAAGANVLQKVYEGYKDSSRDEEYDSDTASISSGYAESRTLSSSSSASRRS